MGSMLTKAVLSTNVERKSLANGFRVGLAEMNGWRNKMEDAHVIHMKEDWGFFGVFDGHGGDQCSIYIADKFYKQLEEHGCPKDDEDMRRICFDLDKQFLAEEKPSGSTAAMCIVHRPAEAGGKMRLRVVNIGDSRVLLGRRDGTIVDGGGTDEGLSTDHKPDHPVERERIERCGGHVEMAQGNVPRVNGDLAVSRGFGDAEYKKAKAEIPETVDPANRPVTVDPEQKEFTCDQADFLVIVCDGVSEGDFSNPEVIKLIADAMDKGDDLGTACKAVIMKAEEQNSKDNITCMIVLFNNESDKDEDEREFTPGPLDKSSLDAKFLDAYESMAKRAGLTLGQAINARYDLIKDSMEAIGDGEDDQKKKDPFVNELLAIGEPAGEKGSSEQAEWFETWRTRIPAGGAGLGPDPRLFSALAQHPDLCRELMKNNAARPVDGRKVRAPDCETLREAVEAHPELSWDDRMKEVAGQQGDVDEEDKSDGTMKVRFAKEALTAWLPTSVLTVLPDGGDGGVPAGEAPAWPQAAAEVVASGGYAADAPPAAPSDEGNEDMDTD